MGKLSLELVKDRLAKSRRNTPDNTGDGPADRVKCFLCTNDTLYFIQRRNLDICTIDHTLVMRSAVSE